MLVIGNALGVLEGTLSTGVVSGFRNFDGYKVLQTDASANHGNSGGPMLNESAQVIGVVTFKVGEGVAENLNFAVPISYARGMLLSSVEALTFADLANRLGKTSDLFADKVASVPKRWKSLTSGTIRTIRIDGGYIYVENIFTDQQRQAGNFALSEVRKTGDKFSGTTRGTLVGSHTRFGQERLNRCTFQDPIEITLLTPSRIEGIAFGWKSIDYSNCSRDSARPESFVWIPE